MKLAAAVGSAVSGGILLAFSTFVMPALNRLGPERATVAMSSINVTAQRPPLMIVLFGTAVLTVATGIAGVRQRDGLLVVGSALFLVGVIGTTAGINVPLNDALAQGTATWVDFYRSWMVANHVRSLAGIAAAVLIGTAAIKAS